MKLIIFFVAVCCTVVFFTACKKNDNTPLQQKLLVAGKWVLTACTATTNYLGNDTTIDVYATMDACEKDNIMTFANNGIATLDEGADVCPGKTQTSTATWFLLDNNTKIAIIDSNPDTMGLDVTSTQMQLTLAKLNTSGSPISYIYTYNNIR